ncbi:glutamate receptor ionotropic, kainate 3-like isoform X4 [Branchiostoma lanceolatum]|uniref:glutamate receptor ionotropic, kainate 3-like isoform X4 n=1 Tax=Branchiostoma lanceolatum TaxID=7740 RepID=UPI003456CDF6
MGQLLYILFSTVCLQAVAMARPRVDLPPVFGNVSHTRQKTAGDRAEGLMRKIRGRTDRAAFPGANTTMHKPPALSPTWLRNKVVVIVIVEEPPFIIKRGEDGKEEFEGFCIDLITELAKEVDFEFHLYTVDDGKYGSQDADGNWNGLVKDLMENKADLALAPLTISSDRERAIDFTKPFMEYGTGLLIKKPPSEGRYLFAFLMPFQIVVWICILVALVCVGFMLYVTSRIRYMLRVGEPFDNDRAFTLRNSIWFAYWSLVKRGGEPAPRSLPIRILAGFWWLFALIVVSTYTANLTAFLTVKRLSSPIASLEDLAKQTEIAYGLEKDVFLYNFFREQDGTGSVFERMWHSMSADPNNFASSLNEGIEKVRDGNYVFMDDEPILEYLVANDENCELMLVGKPFLYRGYGIATQRDGHLLDKLSVQILKMQESGRIGMLRDRWWPKEGCVSDHSPAAKDAVALGIDNVLGVFYVLLGGAGLSFITAAAEIIYHRCCRPKLPKEKQLRQNRFVLRELFQCWRGRFCETQEEEPANRMPATVSEDTEEIRVTHEMLKFLRCIENGSLKIVARNNQDGFALQQPNCVLSDTKL